MYVYLPFVPLFDRSAQTRYRMIDSKRFALSNEQNVLKQLKNVASHVLYCNITPETTITVRPVRIKRLGRVSLK